MIRLCASLVVAALSAATTMADNWPQWRGPTATGVAATGTYPVSFSDTENVAWKVALPGMAPSTPAVWDDHIFVTGPINEKDGVLCFDRQGNERWRIQFGQQAKARHKSASGANSSPLTDGKRVYVYFMSGTIAALDFDGHVVWQDNLQKRFGENTLMWDLGTSPVLAGGHLVVAVMQEGDSFIVALDPATGATVWKEERIFKTAYESDQSYTTPNVVTIDGRDRIIAFGADHLTAHDAATGETLWALDGFNPSKKKMWRNISSASVWNNIAVVSYGRGKMVCAIDLKDGLKPKQRWLWKRDDLGADVPTPVTHDGKAYLLQDNGKLACLHIYTGKDFWISNAPKVIGQYFASPVLAGSTLYCANKNGTVVTGTPGQTFQNVTTNQLNESVVATPIAIDDRLLIRGEKHLFCLGN